MYFVSRHLTYKTENIIDSPTVINKWITNTSGKNNINIGSPFKINNDITIEITNDGKKLIKLDKEIEIGIK